VTVLPQTLPQTETAEDVLPQTETAEDKFRMTTPNIAALKDASSVMNQNNFWIIIGTLCGIIVILGGVFFCYCPYVKRTHVRRPQNNPYWTIESEADHQGGIEMQERI
jgi:hypothetical protein